jgi:hypothetical protein
VGSRWLVYLVIRLAQSPRLMLEPTLSGSPSSKKVGMQVTEP